jgi:hypothetical protein
MIIVLYYDVSQGKPRKVVDYHIELDKIKHLQAGLPGLRRDRRKISPNRIKAYGNQNRSNKYEYGAYL